jgi:hypothetical protein
MGMERLPGAPRTGFGPKGLAWGLADRLITRDPPGGGARRPAGIILVRAARHQPGACDSHTRTQPA